MKKQLNELKENNNTCLNDVQENTSIKLNTMMETIQDLKYEFSKEIEILNRSQYERKMD